jgi:hypothetical protein
MNNPTHLHLVGHCHILYHSEQKHEYQVNAIITLKAYKGYRLLCQGFLNGVWTLLLQRPAVL